MSAGGDDLVALALALLKRGASASQLLEVMGETEPARRGRPPQKAQAEPGQREKRGRHVKHADILAVLRDAPGPLTTHQIVQRLPALTLPAAHRHVYRGVEIGTVTLCSRAPNTYTLSSAGRKRASKASPVPSSEAPAVTSGPLHHAHVLATIGRLRSATMATIREAIPRASRTAIYQHLTRGIDDGELSRTGKGQAQIFSLKAKGASLAASSTEPKASPRMAEVCAALRKTGRAMTAREIAETYFPKMRVGTVEQHVLMSFRRGLLVRHGAEKPFSYTVKPLKESKPKATPKGTLGRELLLAELRKAAQPLLAKEIYKLFPSVLPHSVDTQLANRVKDGSVVRIGKEKPYTYKAQVAPALPLAKSHANGTPVATA